MITAANLIMKYYKNVVLNVESMQINPGEIVGLIGNNGAGKTTMLSLFLDLIKPAEGYVKIKDKNVARDETWKTYTGAYLNERFLIPFLTPFEFLTYIGSLHGKNKADVESFLEANHAFFTEDISGKYIRDLSTGNKQKTGILGTFLSDPELIILDEPFSALDPSSQAWLKNKLSTLHAEGKTLIVSSHDLKHVTDICKRILLIEKGKIVMDLNVNAETLPKLEEYFMVKQ